MKTYFACRVTVGGHLLSMFWFLVVFQPGWSKFYQSIQWTPQNPKFQFTKEQIQDSKAYYRLPVLPNNRVAFVCPNPSTYLNDVQHPVPENVKLYENIWYVDEESFQACKVGSPKGKGINQKWLNCDTPSVLTFDWLVFVPFTAINDLSLQPGTEHHFIATSNGSSNSLDNRSGGHCNDTGSGISMKMIIYVCYNGTDPACNVLKTDPPTENNNSTTVKTDLTTQALRTSLSDNVWHLLTVIFGVGFSCCLVVLSLCLFVVCRRETLKQSEGEKDKLHPYPLTNENDLENVNGMTDTCI